MLADQQKGRGWNVKLCAIRTLVQYNFLKKEKKDNIDVSGSWMSGTINIMKEFMCSSSLELYSEIAQRRSMNQKNIFN